MPLNVPGLFAPFQLLWTPRLIVPALCVKDIRRLDFPALKKAGFRGAVFDKDNCLTLPNHDTLVPELTEAWKECKDTFGSDNVLIVSNSAGTRLDAGAIQAESVSHHLGVTVLIHNSMKPSYTTIEAIRRYFRSLPTAISDDQLIIVGDRLFTDTFLANRMRYPKWHILNTQARPQLGPLAVWTTGVWKKEATLMRWAESKILHLVETRARPLDPEDVRDTSAFTRELVPPPKPTKPALLGDFLKIVGLR